MQREQVAGEKEAGQAEPVGDLLRARLRFERRVLAQERGQRQQPIAPGRPGLGAHRAPGLGRNINKVIGHAGRGAAS